MGWGRGLVVSCCRFALLTRALVTEAGLVSAHPSFLTLRMRVIFPAHVLLREKVTVVGSSLNAADVRTSTWKETS